MIEIAGYQIFSQIYESANSIVYRGQREQDNQAVILKVLKQDYPKPQELTRYKQEYEITRNLNIDGVVKAYALQPLQRTLVIILEDFGSKSLKQLFDDGVGAIHKLPLPEFLNIAIKIAEILGAIHGINVIHKDINPSNIVLNADTGQLKIIDFGISTQLTRENPTLKNPNVLEGTLPYISPEQTGRMNRALDYRTDFYSLGVTFYELLTGKLPFETADALELVHCHIAKQPVPPHELVEGTHESPIPTIVSNIVMKLMAKTAEERYQSAWGLKADLEECLFQLQAKGTISEFPIGSKDISDKFQIPQKLYGRESEVKTLLTAFDRVSQGTTEMMLVAGYSGIGKSALVAEVHKPITEKRGYFIWGKFDQFQRNIPYSAIVSAFAGLVRQLLTESEAQLNCWREKLLAAFGTNGQVIIDVIPDVELIIGKQPPVPELGPSESQNRFNLVFQNFIRAFCTKEHPLVIFLDDLQWADSATLNLTKLMMTDADTQYLFLIGAYRDNEVNPTHPLMITLDELRNVGATVNFITLAPLDSKHISRLIADTLHSDTSSVKPLAELVVHKTGGNPFFVYEFLKTLHAENLITFNLPQSPTPLSSPLTKGGQRGVGEFGWQWDISNIEAKGITDNVVELMIGKLKKLPSSTQQVLRLAACVGADFDLNTLSIISEKSTSEVFKDLAAAVQSGLILPTSDLDEDLLIQDYTFLHDRVQQAAYSLIDEKQKQEIHLKIGRILLNNFEDNDFEERIFDIVNHLNKGQSLLVEKGEKKQLARLNLIAGKKAKFSSAYQPALLYITNGMKLLSPNTWEEDYQLTFSYHLEKGELEYLTASWDEALSTFDEALEHIDNLLDRCKVAEYKVTLYRMKNDLKSSLYLGVQTLNLLGIKLKAFPEEDELIAEVNQANETIAAREIENFIDLPEMQDPEKLAAMVLLRECVPPSYFLGSRLLFILGIKMIELSLAYGNSPHSSVGYIYYSLTLAFVAQDFETAYKFGILALRLNDDKYQMKPYEALILNMWGGFVSHYTEHLDRSREHLMRGYYSGVENGAYQWAGYCASNFLFMCFWGTDSLKELSQKINKLTPGLKKVDPNMVQYYYAIKATIYNLIEPVEDWSVLDESLWPNAKNILKSCLEKNDLTTVFLEVLCKLSLANWYSDAPKAIDYANSAEKYLIGTTGIFTNPAFHFHQCLALSVGYDYADGEKQAQYVEKIQSNLEKFKLWSKHCPSTYLHQRLLIEAELARITGNVLEAQDLYDQAISSARENKFLQNEALASELAAKFWLGKGKEKIAKVYMSEAHYGYQFWGAKRKVKDLEEKYPQLLPTSSATKSVTSTYMASRSTSTGTQSGEALDLATVMKASQAISSEIMLDKLLENLMKILIQNTGAQTGFLLLDKAGEWVIEASWEVNTNNITVLQSIPIDQHLPMSLINYVSRTKETVVKSDAAQQGNFTNDPYIKANKIKSILCTPLINQGQLSGIVYLENNLTTGAFTPDRLEVIQLLSGQAAIAIDNARLYNNLEQKVAERTQELAQALEELKTTQDELIQKEKMAALGQLIAGIAHEINTPLGAIRSSAGNIAKFLDQTLEQLPSLFQSLSKEDSASFMGLLQRSLQHQSAFSTKEERQLKRALRRELESSEIDNADIIAERLVIMGISDEIDSFIPLFKKTNSFEILEIAYKLSELKRGTATINISTDRASKVVFALKTYARYDHSGEMILSHLSEGIDTILTLYQNQLKQGVEVIKNYTKIPPVSCYPDELNQVWTNLIHNALQAMDNRGTLTIDVTQVNQQAKISITDSGSGIPEEIRSKIFEPFFTTKPAGEGSGLGLDIVKKIIDKHSGHITVESQPGRTTFHVLIPVQSDK